MNNEIEELTTQTSPTPVADPTPLGAIMLACVVLGSAWVWGICCMVSA